MYSPQTSVVGVRAIVVAWNPGAWLERSVTSLLRSGLGQGQVWIVDHATTDGSIAALVTAYPTVQVVSHMANRSYGEAVNLAAAHCGGDLLLIVNPDTELHPGCLERLIARLQADTMAAAVGPRLIDGSGRDVTRFGRTRFHQAVAALAAPGVFSGWQNRLFHSSERRGMAVPVTFVEASVMLVRREAFDAVGGFDEQFTFYGDDADLCRSLRRCGYRLWHEPAAMAMHAVSAIFAQAKDRQRQTFMDGILLVTWKRSLRRYRWKRRGFIVILQLLGMWQRASRNARWSSTQTLLRRVVDESYLPDAGHRPGGEVSLTVVIPTRGRPECVDRLLEGLAQQDDRAFDVVLVVQGEGRGYDAVGAKWKDVLALRRMDLSVENRGAAKNAGARGTEAEIVLFCDDDIIPPPELIRVHRSAYHDPTIGAMSCRVVEGSEPVEAGDDRLRLTWYGRIVGNAYSSRSGPAEVAACGNMSFRRRVLMSFGGFDPLMRGTANLEEFDVSERVRGAGWRIWFDGGTTVRHHPQPDGNEDFRRQNAMAYYRTLHHNLALILRRHRPFVTTVLGALWAAGRSILQAKNHGLSPWKAIPIWWGYVDGLSTYRHDQT